MKKGQTILETIQAVAVEQNDLKKEDIKPESLILNDLGVDSLELIEMLMAVEDVYDIEISGDAIEKVRTVQEFVDVVQELISKS